MSKRKLYGFLLFMMITGLFSGCVSYSNLQSAETLEPGHIRFGAGAVTFVNPDVQTNEISFLPEASVRLGLFKGVDAGFKYSHPLTFVADTKIQFIRHPVNAAIDFGVSVMPVGDILAYGFYPTILVGRDHWYAGVKGTFLNFSNVGDTPEVTDMAYLGTTLITGLVIGKEHVKLLLELNTLLAYETYEPLFIPACGLYFEL